MEGMDEWMGDKREREAAGGGRRASIGVACVSHPTRGVRPKRTARSTPSINMWFYTVYKEEEPSVFRHSSSRMEGHLCSISTTRESGQIKCRGPFYVHFGNLSINVVVVIGTKNKTYSTFDV